MYRHHLRLLRDGLGRWMAGTASPVGMPSYPDFVAGVAGAMDHVRANHYHGKVLAVTSGGPIAAAVGQVLLTPPETTIEPKLRIRNTSVTEFAFTPKRHMMVGYNAIPHLDQAGYDDWGSYS
ncbi:MAG: histidine phosphatase family protein [Ramlibacter sp.]|jgi:broad specificity phosphatase PhoE|nr:histidine phosphatase family protein [Ramlibacter sp.]